MDEDTCIRSANHLIWMEFREKESQKRQQRTKMTGNMQFLKRPIQISFRNTVCGIIS